MSGTVVPVPRVVPRAVAAVAVLSVAAVLVGCGSSTPVRLRRGTLRSLLAPIALDAGTYCTLVPPAEEEEGGLDGAVERAGVTFAYSGPRPDPLHSSLHVGLDRFTTTAAARRRLREAATSSRDRLGPDADAEPALPGWPGSSVFSSTVLDYTGTRRVSVALVVAVADTVIRITSFGVPDLDTPARFRRVATTLLDGLVSGDAPLHRIDGCSPS